MADEYWVVAYILAGIIVVMLVFKFYEFLYEHDMDQSEKREYELLNSALSHHPGMKAFLVMLLWVFWPIIVLAAICFTVIIGIAGFVDGVDWLKHKIRK